MTTALAISFVLLCVVGVVLTLLTLPGTWLMVLGAMGLELYQPGTFSWWTIGASIALAVIGEAVEFAASAAGAKKTGGGRAAAIFSVVGGLAGAIAGTIVLAFLPIIGTIIGAVVGAGVGAAAGEKFIAKKAWDHTAKVAAGAAAGRLIAVVAKGALAGAMACVLIPAVFIA